MVYLDYWIFWCLCNFCSPGQCLIHLTLVLALP